MLLIDCIVEEAITIFLHKHPGFVLNLKKSTLIRKGRTEFLGVTVDWLTMNLSLSEKKVWKVQQQCLELLQKIQVPLLEF